MIKNAISGLVLGSILTISNIVTGAVATNVTNPAEISISQYKKKSKRKDNSHNRLIALVTAIQNGEITKEDAVKEMDQIVTKSFNLIAKKLEEIDYNEISIKDAKELLSNVEGPFKGWQLMFKDTKIKPTTDFEHKMIGLFNEFDVKFNQFITHLKILADKDERKHFLAFYNGTYEDDLDEELDTTTLSAPSLSEGWS